MAKVLFDFVTNNPIAVFVIGGFAYFIVGKLMSFLRENFGMYLGKQGGYLAWLIVAISLSAIYHFLMEVYNRIAEVLRNVF